MQKKKFLTYMLIATTAITALPLGVLADTNSGNTQGIEGSSLVDGKSDVSIPIAYTVGATFAVKLPSSITFTKDGSGWGYAGTVGVKGDIDAGKAVSVTPDDSMTLYDVTNRSSEEVPAGENDQNYPHKDSKSVDVVQIKTSFAQKEINPDTYTDTDLTLKAGDMQAGKWKGNLNVEIIYGDVGTEPGLYADDSTMTKSWSLIKSEGTVHVSNDGGLTTNYNVDTDTNASSDALGGSLVLDGEVKSLGDDALNNCDSLTSVTIPETVTSIGDNALKGCDSLTEVSYEGTRDQWESVSKGDGWSDGTSVGTVTCSDGDAMIAMTETAGLYGSDGSFTPWSTLVSDGKITVTDNVIQSGSDTSMEGRLVIADGVTSLGIMAFSQCSNLKNINIPNSVTSIGDGAFKNCSGLTSINIPNSVTSIGSSTFYNCSGLTSITIPNSVTSIGSSTFYNCRGLTSITIPDGVTSIGNNTFDGCSGLTSITIPDSVTSIGDSAFYGCTGLTSITIPESVTSIGSVAFKNCSSLTSITIPDSVTSIGDSAFAACRNLKNIRIPESVTSIGSSAFDGCSGLTSITIPDGVTSIGNNTFIRCSSLTSITIPDGVTSIGSSAFDGCSGLTSITIPDGVTSIGDSTFIRCSSLTSITIPSSVTSIGNSAFSSCSGLTSITIPNSVTSIRRSAFFNCSKLADITFTGTQGQWNAIKKESNWNTRVPATVVHCTNGAVTL